MLDMPNDNDVNAYGDSDESLGFLAGRGANPYNWDKPAIAGPSNSVAGAGAYPGAGSHAGHSAHLGPTNLPHVPVVPVKSYGDPMPGSDDGMPAWRRGLEDYSGGDRVYTEAETLGFFKDAAAGYDFNEEGEAALEEAMITIGIKNQGDTFPEYVSPHGITA